MGSDRNALPYKKAEKRKKIKEESVEAAKLMVFSGQLRRGESAPITVFGRRHSAEDAKGAFNKAWAAYDEKMKRDARHAALKMKRN